MARRRDRVTRDTERIARNYGIRANRIPVMNNVDREMAYASGVPEAVYRSRGRRGVRARARQNRIADRRVEGTYRQPGNGTPGNSP